MSDKKNSDELNSGNGFLDKVDVFFAKRENGLFWLSLFGLILFSLLHFQANISIGGDDSFYIIRAQKFVQEWKFPAFQGPLYPLVLSPLIALFGLNVPLLKSFTILFMALFLFLFYRTYRGRINSTVLMFSVLILAFNNFVLHYASQTYNEGFHLMIQLIFFYQFFKVYDLLKGGDANFKEQYKEWLLLGFAMFLMAISKNLGLVGIITVSGFFLIHGKWKALLASIGSWSAFMLAYSGIKSLLFESGAQISKQGMMLLYKDPYNFSKGKEDLAGYFNRFIDNSNIYISKNLMKIFQLRDAGVTDRVELITVIFVLLAIVGMIITFKKNKYLFFTGAYLLVTLAIIFVVLQTRWDADRLVFLVVPFFCVFVLGILDMLIRRSKLKFLQPLFLILISYYTLSNIVSSTKDIDLLTLKKNLSGDKYLGYTTDWKNFLKLSEWSGKNLPDDAYVASRKSAMSSIYADGKRFHSIGRVLSENPDTLLDQLQSHNVTHVIMAKLRRNPKEKSEYTINTVHRYLSYIEKAYPGTFRAVHQEGKTNDEEAILFEINYNVRANRQNIP